MKMNTLINLSHLTSLLFGISLGIVTTMFCLLTDQNCEFAIYYILIAVAIMVIAIILRIITLNIYKKHKL